jgi:hypothetical protein
MIISLSKRSGGSDEIPCSVINLSTPSTKKEKGAKRKK